MLLLWNLNTIYHDPCAGRSPGPRDEPFLGVLIVKRPRGNNRKSSNKRPSQSNPKREVNILVNVSDDRRDDLVANKTPLALLMPKTTSKPHGKRKKGKPTPEIIKRTVDNISAMCWPWKSYPVSISNVAWDSADAVLTIWPSKRSWIGARMSSIFVSVVVLTLFV